MKRRLCGPDPMFYLTSSGSHTLSVRLLVLAEGGFVKLTFSKLLTLLFFVVICHNINTLNGPRVSKALS